MLAKKIFLVAGLLFSISMYSFAQIRFQKTFGGSNHDEAYSVQQTTDGGYVIGGRTNSFGAGNYGVYLIKTNTNGDTLWTKTFGGSNVDEAYSVKQTTDDGYVIVGDTKSSGAGDYDVYLIKTNASGVILWTKTFGGSNTDWGNSVQQTSDGGYIIVGVTYSFGVGDGNVYLIKTNANGDTLWTKTIGRSYPASSIGNSVQQTSDGGYVIAGQTKAGAGGNDQLYLIKTNNNGDTLWTKIIGGGYPTLGYSIQQTSDDGYVIGGERNIYDVTGTNAYLMKTNTTGDPIWTKTIGGNDFDFGYSVQQTTDGGYVLAGSTRSFGAGDFDVFLIKTNSNGDTLWTKTFGGIDYDGGSSVQQTTDGGYVIAGQTSSFGAGGGDVYLIKTDASGVVAVKSEGSALLSFTLDQNYPNPFNPTTTIRYYIPERSLVILKIFDLSGQQVAELVNKEQPAGSYTIKWQAGGFPSGVYFYRLQSNNFIETKKLILLK
jgi:hypothetical protein